MQQKKTFARHYVRFRVVRPADKGASQCKRYAFNSSFILLQCIRVGFDVCAFFSRIHGIFWQQKNPKIYKDDRQEAAKKKNEREKTVMPHSIPCHQSNWHVKHYAFEFFFVAQFMSSLALCKFISIFFKSSANQQCSFRRLISPILTPKKSDLNLLLKMDNIFFGFVFSSSLNTMVWLVWLLSEIFFFVLSLSVVESIIVRLNVSLDFDMRVRVSALARPIRWNLHGACVSFSLRLIVLSVNCLHIQYIFTNGALRILTANVSLCSHLLFALLIKTEVTDWNLFFSFCLLLSFPSENHIL